MEIEVSRSDFLRWMAVFVIASGFALSTMMQGFQDPHYLPVLLGLCIVMVAGLMQRRLALPSSGPVLCVLMLWALNGVGLALSSIPFASQIAFCVFCTFPLSFIGVSLLGPKAERPLFLCGQALFSALAAVALWQAGFQHRQAAWPFIDPTALAILFGIGLTLLTGAALAVVDQRKRRTAIAFAMVLFSGLAATGSRDGMLTGVISVGLLLWLSRTKFAARVAIPVILTTGGIAVLVSLASRSGLWSGLGQLLINSRTDPSVTDRLSLWRSAWKMMLDHPWTGLGPGTFAAWYPSYREPLLQKSYGFFAHMDPLQMGTELGVIGPVLFYALLISVLVRTIRATMAAEGNRALRLRILTPFMALLGIALEAHVSFPLYQMPMLIACGVLLAVWHRATVEATGDGLITLAPSRMTARIGPALAGLTVTAAILALAAPAGMATWYMNKARAVKVGDTRGYLEALAKAQKIGPKSFTDPEIEMVRVNLGVIEQAGPQNLRLKKQFLNQTDAMLTSAQAWNPASADIDYLHGRLYLIEGRPTEAMGAWQTALEKNPQYFQARVVLAQLFKNHGKVGDAVQVASDGLNYPHPLDYRDWAVKFIQSIPQ